MIVRFLLIAFFAATVSTGCVGSRPDACIEHSDCRHGQFCTANGFCHHECSADSDCPCGSFCASSCGICLRNDFANAATCVARDRGLVTAQDVRGVCRADIPPDAGVPADAAASSDGGDMLDAATLTDASISSDAGRDGCQFVAADELPACVPPRAASADAETAPPADAGVTDGSVGDGSSAAVDAGGTDAAGGASDASSASDATAGGDGGA